MAGKMQAVGNVIATVGNTIRDHKRELMLAGALGGATVLSACGSVSEKKTTTTFTVGVECADGSDVKVTDVTEVRDGGYSYNDNDDKVADIDVECIDGEGEVTSPVAMELLDGPGSTIVSDGGESQLTHLDIDVHYQQGGGLDGEGDQDPNVELSAYEGNITVNQVLSIDRVEVG